MRRSRRGRSASPRRGPAQAARSRTPRHRSWRRRVRRSPPEHGGSRGPPPARRAPCPRPVWPPCGRPRRSPMPPGPGRRGRAGRRGRPRARQPGAWPPPRPFGRCRRRCARAAPGSRRRQPRCSRLPRSGGCAPRYRRTMASISDLYVIASGLDHPEGVATGPDGTLWAGGEAGQVYRIDSEAGTATEVANTGGFVLGIAHDAAGRLYLCDAGRQAILRVDPRSGESASGATPPAGRRSRRLTTRPSRRTARSTSRTRAPSRSTSETAA